MLKSIQDAKIMIHILNGLFSGGVIQPLITKICARSLIAHLGLKNDLKASKKIFGLIFNGQTTKFKTFERLSEYK